MPLLSTALDSLDTPPDQVGWPAEVSGYLVGSPAFKAGGTGDPRPAGSIPVHLRQDVGRRTRVRRGPGAAGSLDRGTTELFAQAGCRAAVASSRRRKSSGTWLRSVTTCSHTTRDRSSGDISSRSAAVISLAALATSRGDLPPPPPISRRPTGGTRPVPRPHRYGDVCRAILEASDVRDALCPNPQQRRRPPPGRRLRSSVAPAVVVGTG